MAPEGHRKRLQARNDNNDPRLRAPDHLEFLLVLTLPIEVVLHRRHYLPNGGKEILALRKTGVIRHPPLRTIVTNGVILHPILVRQSNPLLLFDHCPRVAHPRGRGSPLPGKKARNMAVATSELIRRYLGQAQAEVEVAAAV